MNGRSGKSRQFRKLHLALVRLQKEVCSGRSVFFVGAGMSIDSEQNTARRLLLRLLIRLRAFNLLAAASPTPRLRRIEERINHDFQSIFWIHPTDMAAWRSFPVSVDCWKILAESDPTVNRHHMPLLDRVTSQYYEFNDWICGIFSSMLQELHHMSDGAVAFLAELHLKEADLLAATAGLSPSETVPLHPIEAVLYRERSRSNFRHEGKALFLDTMGFRDEPRIMGGIPAESETLGDLRAIQESYRNKLFPRHKIWARFAREGWAPLILTTNFDRLVEGAFRLAGFRAEESEGSRRIPVPMTHCTTISDPGRFFDRAGRGRSALVMKIHGCALQYEERWKPGSEAGSEPQVPYSYLRSMVFTYREVQNWRDDSWSRDYFRSLLRTRTMIFCGYSTRDPVIHDTLRSVYEEMNRDRRKELVKPGKRRAARRAPAFTMVHGKENGRDFHAMEVLRAASGAATSIVPDRSDPHPNYLCYQAKGRGFPDPDDLMLWANHLAYRRTQLEALERELPRVLTTSRRRMPAEEGRIICEDFKSLMREEILSLEGTDERAIARQLERVTRWTYYFHPQLLRECALADATIRENGPGAWFLEMRSLKDYYFPATAQPGWTAWAAFLELVVVRCSKSAGWNECIPAIANQPTLNFQHRKNTPPCCLQIRHCGVEKTTSPRRTRGATTSMILWEIPATSAPWIEFDRPDNPGPVEDDPIAIPAALSSRQSRPVHRRRHAFPGADRLHRWYSAAKGDVLGSSPSSGAGSDSFAHWFPFPKI